MAILGTTSLGTIRQLLYLLIFNSYKQKPNYDTKNITIFNKLIVRLRYKHSK